MDKHKTFKNVHLIRQHQPHVGVRNRLDIIDDKEDVNITPICAKWALNYQIPPEYITKKH